MFNNHIKGIAITFSVLFSIGLNSQNAKEHPDLLAAFQAEGSLQLENSRLLFEKVASNPSASKEDQCKALRALAIQDWKFYSNYDGAIDKLRLADSIGNYASETWLKRTRIEEEAKHFSKAMDAAQKAISLSASEADKTYAQYKYARVILNQALHQINSNIAFNKALLTEAVQILQDVLDKNPTHVNAADVLLGSALLLNDGETSLKAWLSYYRFANVESAYSYLKTTAKTLEQVLPIWNKRPLNQIEQTSLIHALAESRFYNYANALAKTFNLTEQSNIQNIVIYADYVNEVETLTNTYYRQATTEEINSDDYVETLVSKSEVLYEQLETTTKTDTFSFQNFRSLIRKDFGAVLMLGSTSASNIMGLIYGHIVNERERTVEQYGHQADFTFTELDMIVSNGYPSWFWEDRGAGGFAIPDGFLRIKTMFKHLGISAWELITDPIKRSKAEFNIQDNLLTSTATSEVSTMLPALGKKLELDALDALYNDLVSQGYKDAELQLKFIEAYDALRDNATMFAHEGRHSLDRVILGDDYRNLGAATIEFRGRLSQIAFSESPKLEVANMLNGVGTTNNGIANQMIVDVFDKWIKENKQLINTFNETKLPITQLYKLTDDQIRQCIRLADPFYNTDLKD